MYELCLANICVYVAFSKCVYTDELHLEAKHLSQHLHRKRCAQLNLYVSEPQIPSNPINMSPVIHSINVVISAVAVVVLFCKCKCDETRTKRAIFRETHICFWQFFLWQSVLTVFCCLSSSPSLRCHSWKSGILASFLRPSGRTWAKYRKPARVHGVLSYTSAALLYKWCHRIYGCSKHLETP